MSPQWEEMDQRHREWVMAQLLQVGDQLVQMGAMAHKRGLKATAQDSQARLTAVVAAVRVLGYDGPARVVVAH
ncbi:MAG: hypothetical protein CMK74_01165 [Pseudomonadales bacterium]|jgi:hypothetical protein|nr:hypothetical protein [Pseudomonadales bacterium]|tara:strand:- start:271 stop:489 length:219 start_codon:yes stop_codon:yes gene_type:complete